MSSYDKLLCAIWTLYVLPRWLYYNKIFMLIHSCTSEGQGSLKLVISYLKFRFSTDTDQCYDQITMLVYKYVI